MLLQPPNPAIEIYDAGSQTIDSTTLAPPSWLTVLTVNIPSTSPAGHFWFLMSAEWTMDDENNPALMRVMLDGATALMELIVAFKKKYAPGTPLTEFWYPAAGMHQADLVAGPHTVTMEIAAGGGKTTYIRDKRLGVWRVR